MNNNATEQMQVWKNAELVRARVELVKSGLRMLDAGCPYFGADDIPENVVFNGAGIVGSAVHALRSAHVIEDCWAHLPENGIVHGRRKSRHKSANGRKVGLYQIASRAAASEFLRRHGYATVDRQIRLTL